MRKIRKFLDLKQSQIAYAMNISSSGYSKMERGEIPNPSLTRLEQFSEISGRTLTDMLSKTADELIQVLVDQKKQPQ